MSAVQPAATAIPTTPAADNSTAPAAATNGTGSAFGSVAATPEPGDVEYLSPVNIGGQTITLDFDSGSSDLWVFNSQLPAASTTNHMVFDITKSTTFKMMDGASYSVSYGDGSGSAGNVGTDTVNIGGVTVTSQAVELPTAVSASFVQDTASNGLLGLAFSKLNTVKPTQQKTFFDNAIPTLQTPVFTADLRHAVPGAYEFGTIDSTKFNGTMQWAPINTTNGFWQFSSQSASLGAAGAVQLPGGQAIADTGTTLMLMDPSIVNAYYSQVTGAANDAQAGGVTFPCSATLPDMAVDIGGQFMATVRGSDINFAPVDQSGTSMFPSPLPVRESSKVEANAEQPVSAACNLSLPRSRSMATSCSNPTSSPSMRATIPSAWRPICRWCLSTIPSLKSKPRGDWKEAGSWGRFLLYKLIITLDKNDIL
jgi:hypothetical protein